MFLQGVQDVVLCFDPQMPYKHVGMQSTWLRIDTNQNKHATSNVGQNALGATWFPGLPRDFLDPHVVFLLNGANGVMQLTT